MLQKPIKRDKSIQPLSREHHHSLLLCWKIKEGFKKDIDVTRIKNYCNWFYRMHLLPHFDIEEKYVFTVLDSKHELVKKAISEHKRLKRLFESDTDVFKNLSLIEEELESHIRFEERVLFAEVQQLATQEQLQLITEHHIEEKFEDNLSDPFWLK